MEIRRATVEDARGIATVHVASWQAAYRGRIPDDFLDGLDGSIGRRAERWVDGIGDPGLDVFVADDDGIVAFASASASRDDDLPDHGELQTLYALRSVWSTGVGHALHDVVVDGLRGRGFDRGLVWVLDGNERMLDFCERHGWGPDGVTKDEDWGDLVLHEVRLVRSL